MQKIKLGDYREFRDNQCSMQETSKENGKDAIAQRTTYDNYRIVIWNVGNLTEKKEQQYLCGSSYSW